MKGRANDKIRTELRGGWPKLIGRAFSTIVDSLFLLFLPSIHIARDIYGASRSFSRNISKAMTRGYLFFSSLVEPPWRERRIALFFYFIFFLQGETSLFFRGRDFSRSTVAQFSKIRRDSLLPLDASHPSISRDYPSSRFDLCSGKEVYSFFLWWIFVGLGDGSKMEFRNWDLYRFILNIKKLFNTVIWWNEYNIVKEISFIFKYSISGGLYNKI